jgi:hypothetical protein
MAERSFTRRRLEGIVEEALRAAGVLGVLPTPLEALAASAGVHRVEPIERLPAATARVLGAVSFPDRTIYVDERQPAPRRRFTEAHEIAHALFPWHEAILRLDTEAELFRPVVSTIEAEANAGAALLIFQGRAFAGRLAGEPPGLDHALELADAHGASAHATLHHLVELHPGAAALLAVGRFPARDGSLPVFRSVGSPAFAARFGRAADRLPVALEPGSPLRDLAEAARGCGRATATLRLADRSGRSRACTAESYYNRHSFLVLVTERRIRPRSAAA